MGAVSRFASVLIVLLALGCRGNQPLSMSGRDMRRMGYVAARRRRLTIVAPAAGAGCGVVA